MQVIKNTAVQLHPWWQLGLPSHRLNKAIQSLQPMETTAHCCQCLVPPTGRGQQVTLGDTTMARAVEMPPQIGQAGGLCLPAPHPPRGWAALLCVDGVRRCVKLNRNWEWSWEHPTQQLRLWGTSYISAHSWNYALLQIPLCLKQRSCICIRRGHKGPAIQTFIGSWIRVFFPCNCAKSEMACD